MLLSKRSFICDNCYKYSDVFSIFIYQLYIIMIRLQMQQANQDQLVPFSQNKIRYLSKKQIILLTQSFALSSFYFGYSLIYLACIPINTIIQAYNISLTKGQAQGFLNGCIPFGAIFGGYLIKPLMNKFSRRKCILVTNIIATIAGVLIYIPNFYTLMIFRLLQGVCVGIFSGIPSIILKELSPVEISGTIGTMTQLNLTVGIILGYMLTYLLKKITGDYACESFWFIIFGVSLIPIFIQSFILIFIYPYETPKYLLVNNENQQAQRLIRLLYKEEYVQQVMQQKIQDLQKSKTKFNYQTILSQQSDIELKPKSLKVTILMAFHVGAFQQMSGVNAINIYCGPIIQEISTGQIRLMIPTLLISMKFIGTIVTSYALTKVGRKTILQFGLFILCLVNLTIFVGFQIKDESPNAGSTVIIISMFIYLIIFGFTIGPVVWIYLSEIVEPKIFSNATVVNWICSASVVILFPILKQNVLNGNPQMLFLFFSLWCGLSFAINRWFLVQTKDKTQRQIREEYLNMKIC